MEENIKIENKDSFLFRFCEIVQKFPQNPAIIENGDRVTTYSQLLNNSLKIANYLNNKSAGMYVGVAVDKSAKYIETILGCWFAKKAFVPLGSNLPENRRNYIINDAKINFVFTEETYDNAISCAAFENIDVEIQQNQPAYIIYTSGTTGKPKGVLVSHNGIVNLADCQRKAFEVDENSKYLFYLSTNFDASISDISVTLLSGAALIIEKESALNIASELAALTDNRKITHLDIPPALLKLLDASKNFETLKTIVIGGETCDVETVKQWADKVNLVNVYGPTEATVCTSMCKCTKNWSTPLIGEPMENIDYNICAEANTFSSSQNACGELYISGVGLALGYVNNEKLTNKKFVNINGKRYYKTGDLVERCAEGLKFLGRTDRQFKLRGQLIEPEEIEKCLNNHPSVCRACVLKRPIYQGSSDALVAFVQLKNDINVSELNTYLKTFLPDWMVPARIEIIGKMPVTQSEKIDMNKLLQYEFAKNEQTPEEKTYQLSETEQKVVNIFKKILGVSSVSVNDNFFELGGSSLDALELIFACQKLGAVSGKSLLMQEATPRLIARSIGESESAMMMSTRELAEDIKFVQNFEISQNIPSEKNAVLITGATGFLGSHLLKELLEKTDYVCYCLIRGDSELQAFERLKDTFKKYSLAFEEDYNCRIRVVCGDITKENLGLSGEVYEKLSNTVFRIYHCAALVNMLYPYEKLKAGNLNSVKHILKFSTRKTLKELHYASTLSVFVSTDKNVGTVYEDDRLDDINYVWGGYGQTKFAAEKYLLNSELKNVYIYRFGLICASTSTGISAPKDFLSMFIDGAATLAVLPRDKTKKMAVDITPVDYAVASVVKISESSTNKRVFHIANRTPLFYNDFINIIKSENLVSDIVDYELWKSTLLNKKLSVNEQACLMALCRMEEKQYKKYRFMDLFQATDIKFDDTNTVEITGMVCPLPTKDLIKKYILTGGQNG